MSGKACSRKARSTSTETTSAHREHPTVSTRTTCAFRRVRHVAGRHRPGRHWGELSASENLSGDGVAPGGVQGRAIAEQCPPPHSPTGETQLPADADGYHHQQKSGAQGGAGSEARGEPIDAGDLRESGGRLWIGRGLAGGGSAHQT